MSLRSVILASALVVLVATSAIPAQTVEVIPAGGRSQVMVAKRTTLAVKYPDNDGTEVNMVGTALNTMATGKADIKRKEGRTRIKLRMENLPHPQSLGSYYTTYVLWAIAPEGQAENLAELPITKEFDFEVTTSFQTFGLIITAEPHSAVKLPSPVIVAENSLRKGTEGGVEASRIDYSGDAGTYYVVSKPDGLAPGADYSTPHLILGARHAVEIARRAGAAEYADSELRQAEIKLEALEQVWPRRRNKEKEYSGLARDVMRIAEHARTLTAERREQARLEAERRASINTIAQAQSEADQARSEAIRAREQADRAKEEAASYRDAVARAESEAALARQRLEQAQTEAEKAKASEELARLQAEQSRLEAEQARREKSDLQQKLFISLSEILETRREARGLIVSLSDVLFDFNMASLKPGAREKLSKLAGILMAYPGSYRIEIEGHTDSVGSDEYNLKLSQDRAETVRRYIVQAGIAADRVTATRGLGEIRPVVSNDTAEGRQMNRRVEIVIVETENQQ